jgi:glycosyltransferase involved in cell wall biosynthesis
MNGEGARLIDEARAGISVAAEDGVALADAIIKLYNMPDAERQKLGDNGRSYFSHHFEHEYLVDRLLEHLTDAITHSKYN